MHPIFLTSPIITAIIGPLVVFAACKQWCWPQHKHAPAATSPDTASFHGAYQLLPVAGSTSPSPVSSQEHRKAWAEFMERCAKHNSRATRLFPFQKAPPLSSCTARVTAKLLATPLGTTSRKIFSPPFCDLFFSAFFCGWKTRLPTWEGSDLWLYFSWRNLLGMQVPWRCPGVPWV